MLRRHAHASRPAAPGVAHLLAGSVPDFKAHRLAIGERHVVAHEGGANLPHTRACATAAAGRLVCPPRLRCTPTLLLPCCQARHQPCRTHRDLAVGVERVAHVAHHQAALADALSRMHAWQCSARLLARLLACERCAWLLQLLQLLPPTAWRPLRLTESPSSSTTGCRRGARPAGCSNMRPAASLLLVGAGAVCCCRVECLPLLPQPGPFLSLVGCGGG